jgi:hypothetical protein
MDSMQLPASFLGFELYVVAFRVVVLLGKAIYIHDLPKGRSMIH